MGQVFTTDRLGPSHLWTTRRELIALTAFRPPTAWKALEAFFLLDENWPVPFWDVLERCGLWTTLAAMEAPLLQVQGTDLAWQRARAVEALLRLVASTACLVIPAPTPGDVNDGPGEWLRLECVLGKDAAEVIAQLWDFVERNGAQEIPSQDWALDLLEALSGSRNFATRAELPGGLWPLVRAITSAIACPTPANVTELLLATRIIAWHVALEESEMRMRADAYDLGSQTSVSRPILAAIDRQYEALLYGLMFEGGEHLSSLTLRKRAPSPLPSPSPQYDLDGEL